MIDDPVINYLQAKWLSKSFENSQQLPWMTTWTSWKNPHQFTENGTATKPGYIRESLLIKSCKGCERGEYYRKPNWIKDFTSLLYTNSPHREMVRTEKPTLLFNGFTQTKVAQCFLLWYLNVYRMRTEIGIWKSIHIEAPRHHSTSFWESLKKCWI